MSSVNPVNRVDPDGHRPCDEAYCPGEAYDPIAIHAGVSWYGEWDPEEQAERSEAIENIVIGGAEAVAGIIWEPADWAFIISDCINGNCSPYVLLGLLPLIPGNIGNKISDLIDMVPTPKGGVYTLSSPTGKVVRVGHTKDFISRAGNYRRDGIFFDLIFTIVYRTDDYATRRGLEQMLYDTYKPPLSIYRPIRVGNPNTTHYLDAAQRFLNNFLGIQ